jgi:hypothetical protein
MTLTGIIEFIARTAYFTGVGDTPPALAMRHVPGASRLCLVLGPNASGKSLLRRLAGAACKAKRIEFMPVSMEFRTGQQFGMGRVFVYGGTEMENSTGENSSRSVVGGIRTCRAREAPHVIFWDEPDIGMSDGYARGMGRSIAEFAAAIPEHTVAAFVVTHRKSLVRELLAADPHVVFMGDESAASLDEWLARDEEPQDIEALPRRSSGTYTRVAAIRRALGLRD